ncbi:MAG: D-alanine--poly(phosphoribitol) ligase subunit DltA [Roseburia sp.]
MTILEKINENAKRNPDRLMMIQRLQDKENKLSWKQLNDYSDYLAYWIDKKLTTNSPIVVYGHKNPLMIVCFIACVKTGRAYCPIDVNVPLSRVEAIVNEVKPEMILTTEQLDIDADGIVCLDDIQFIIENGHERIAKQKYIQADEVFYIIFTSGSTGTPKGVQITRDCLDNFIRWAVGLGNGVSDENEYIFLNQAPFSFDLSVMDLFLCLYTGGTLWALSKSIQNDTKSLYKSLKESNANIWVSTPSFVDVCMSDPCFTSDLMPNVTDFLFCGEILTNKTVVRLMERFPDAKVVNTYGPTESTCAVTEVVISDKINKTCSPLPVGKSKPGTWIRIVDENGNIVPEGERGEIVIVGDSVSVGYWNNAEKNRESFGITTENTENYRYYRTGDEGYLLDGMLYYGGRIDLQVKLHGYRIELGDIENNLLEVPGIEQAVVVPKYRDGKVSSLVAGVVYSTPVEDKKETATQIKEALKDNLPEYMIPKKIKFLSDIPRTNNGKIDRKAVGGLL